MSIMKHGSKLMSSNDERHGKYDLIVTVSGVVRPHEDLARGEDASSAQITLQALSQ